MTEKKPGPTNRTKPPENGSVTKRRPEAIRAPGPIEKSPETPPIKPRTSREDTG